MPCDWRASTSWACEAHPPILQLQDGGGEGHTASLRECHVAALADGANRGASGDLRPCGVFERHTARHLILGAQTHRVCGLLHLPEHPRIWGTCRR